MIEITAIDAPNPMEMWDLLDRHGMISAAHKNNPSLTATMCQHGQFYVWHEGGDPKALMVEFIGPDPGVLDVIVIPEDRLLGKRKPEIAELQMGLRDRWFPHFRRIQSHVPASRVNIHRIMKSLGFSEETRRDVGLRDGIKLGPRPEGVVVYGLLKNDPLKVYAEESLV